MAIVPYLRVLGSDGVKTVSHAHYASLARGRVDINLAVIAGEYLRIAGNRPFHDVAVLPPSAGKKHPKVSVRVSGYLPDILKQGFPGLGQEPSPAGGLKDFQRLGVSVAGNEITAAVP